MGEMRVFIVTTGSYSDYMIDGVFETQEKTIQYISQRKWPYDSPRIELWEGGEHLVTWDYKLHESKLELRWDKKQGIVRHDDA